MNNNKKILNYLLTLCAIFTFSLCYVNAEGKKINEIPLEPGDTRSFGDKFNFSSCNNPDPEHFTITGEGSNWQVEYHTAKEGLEIFKYSCTGYKLGEKPESKEWNYELNVSGKRIVDPENGKIERTINVTATQNNLNYCNGVSDCQVKIINDAGGMLSVSGNEIRINKKNDQNGATGQAQVTYVKNGTTYILTINITIPDGYGGAIIYPGDTNLCKIDQSVWKAKDWTDSSNHHHYYYQAKGEAVFPTCSGENSVYPLEFKGWVPTEPNKNITNLNESCSGMVSGNTAASTGSYYACYEAKPTIQIATEANVSNPENWQKVTGMGYYYVGNSKDSVKLPELSFIGFNKKKELDYWENEKGEHKQSGDSVPLDGSVWKAVVKTSSTIDIRGYERNIYMGKVAVFSSVTDKIVACSSGSPSFVEAKMVNGECQAIGLQDTNGEYSAKVFATTDKGETINYNVKVSGYSGSQNGDVAFEVDPNNEDYEVIKKPNKKVIEDKNNDSISFSKGSGSSVIKSSCNRFQFMNNLISFSDGWGYRGDADYFHISNRLGISIKFIAYCIPEGGFNESNTAEPDHRVPISGDEYHTLCLEENKKEPNVGPFIFEHPVYKVSDKKAGKHLQFVLNYIIQNFYNDKNALADGKSAEFVTAQILTRLAWIKDGDSQNNKGSGDQFYWHKSYIEVANAFFSDISVGSSEWNNKVIGTDGPRLADGRTYKGEYYGATTKIDNNTKFSGTGLGIGNYSGSPVYKNIIAYLEDAHNEYLNAGGESGLDKYSDTMSGDGFVGNDVPAKVNGENNPMYETHGKDGQNSYSLTYEGSILTTEKFKGVKMTLEPACNWSGVKCEVVQHPTNSGDIDADGNLMFKYKVKLTVTDAANVKVPESAEEKDKVSFKVLVDGKNVTFNDAVILEVENTSIRDDYQKMLLFREGSAIDAEAKLYFPFLLIPSKCTDVPATNFENYGSAEFNQALFIASNCCNDVTDDVENQELLQQVCQNKCTTSTFTNVCRWNTKYESDAELYLIKEGTQYNSGKYVNQIGACIADVEHDYSIPQNKPFFERTDDNSNSINIDKYQNNRYCQVTCKEDWTISMDSFGNYVGVKAIAAGTSFAINNDMFIGGERTCYTSYVNTDKYMDEMTNLSEKIVKEYNKYSNNSHAYSDIEKSSSGDVKSTETSGLCVKWEDCPSGYSWDGSMCTRTYDASYHDDGWTTCKVEEGDSPYKCSGFVSTHEYHCTCNDGDSLSSCSDSPASGTCKESIELKCKDDSGKYYNYEMKTQNRIEGGTYDRYSVDNQEQKTDGFGTKVDVQNRISSTIKTKYERTEKFTCSYDANKGPNNLAKLTCNYSTSSVAPSEDVVKSISGTVYAAVCGGTNSNNYAFCTIESKSNIQKEFKVKALAKTQEAANAAKAKLSSLYNDVNSYTVDLYECQNFYLFNTSDTRSQNAKKNPSYKSLGNASLVQIDTKYEPAASYKYDEAAFMTLLGKDNIIEEFTKKNKSVMSDWDTANNTSVDAQVVAFDKYGTEHKSDVKLQRNEVITKYYNDSPWSKGTNQYDNYKGNQETKDSDYEYKQVIFCTAGTNKLATFIANGQSTGDYTDKYQGVTASSTTWEAGKCYTVKVKYRKAHYISSYIGNSSFYQNKGNWYMNTVTDIKEHGDNLEGAINNANARSSSLRYKTDEASKQQWTLLNGTTQNVFPVSLTTPRNLYQYSYAFKNIGYFNDNKKLGRIMGDEDSIIESNVRTCFYEIYEDACLCCGSKISTHVDDEAYADFASTSDLLGKMEQIGGGKGDYSYDGSNEDLIGSGSGTLKIIPSTIGLGDITSNYGTGGANIPTNWSTKSPFIYNGAKYYTSKGDVALKQIEEKGEHIYADTAEYSYYLTPDTLAAIREYNDSHGYEIVADNLRIVTDSGIYGYAVDASIGNNGAISANDENRENYVKFQHYGSKFLENEMWSYNAVLNNTLAQTKNNKICYVSGDASDIDNRVKEGCRWVDYIQVNQKVDEKDKRNENVPFRLAFK